MNCYSYTRRLVGQLGKRGLELQKTKEVPFLAAATGTGPGLGQERVAKSWPINEPGESQEWGENKGNLWAEGCGPVSQMGRRGAERVGSSLMGLPGQGETFTEEEPSWEQSYQL